MADKDFSNSAIRTWRPARSSSWPIATMLAQVRSSAESMRCRPATFMKWPSFLVSSKNAAKKAMLTSDPKSGIRRRKIIFFVSVSLTASPKSFMARLPCRPTASRTARRASGLLACLLACLRNIFSTICPNLYLFLFISCARFQCVLFRCCSLSHGLMRLHNGGVPKVSQNTRYRSRSAQRHPSLTRRNRTRAAPSDR